MKRSCGYGGSNSDAAKVIHHKYVRQARSVAERDDVARPELLDRQGGSTGRGEDDAVTGVDERVHAGRALHETHLVGADNNFLHKVNDRLD